MIRHGGGGAQDADPLRAPDLRAARIADLPDLARLEAASFDNPWSENLLRLELDSPHSVVLVARFGSIGSIGSIDGSHRQADPEQAEPGNPVTDGAEGYAALRLIADESELLRVAVRPEGRGHGVGRALIQAGLREVGRRGATRCFLEVRRNNTAAITLYRALGFEETGHRPGYYSDGQDALLMGCRVPLGRRP